MKESVLEIESLVAGYGAATILNGISLAIRPGQLVALVGGNGAGKSTLLRCISGLLHPASGRIRFQGALIERLRPDQIASLGLMHVPEGRHVFADQTTEDNLYLGAYARVRREGRQKIMHEVDGYFERFPQIAQRRHGRAGYLSGGEQQILAIARALIGKPKLLMLDEPSLGLAPKIVETVFELLQEEQRKGMTILLVEQLAFAALSIADYGYLLSHGRIVKQGDAESLLSDLDVEQVYLGGHDAAV